MRPFLAGLILGILIAIAGVWYLSDQRKARDTIQNAADQTKTFVQEKLTPDNIRDEFHRSGVVIRRKAQQAGQAIVDATADARITAAIKAKLLADQHLSSLSISVSTTDGRVTLSGTASSADNIQRAMQIALDTDGVNEVVSTLQVKD